MKTEVSMNVNRPPEVVWPIMVDVERWPEWTSSMIEVRRLNDGPFGVKSKVRIRQPKLKTMIWEVSEFQAGRSFSWEVRSVGVHVVARHEIKPSAGGSTVVLTIDQTGWLAPLVQLLLGGITERYMRMEAEGLKRRSEQDVPTTGG